MSLIDTLAVKVSNLILQGADMSDKQFFEREIQKWKNSPQRIMQIKGHLYYDNEHDILHRKRMMIGEGGKLEEVDNLPNNRLIDNQYAKLVNQKANYLLGQPIAIEGENQQYVELLKKVFNKRFMKTLKAAGKAMLNNGICWLYPYYTETGEFSFRMFPGYEVLPFWKDTEHTILEAAVRLYLVVGYQGTTPVLIEKVEIYDLNGVHRFILDGSTLIPDLQGVDDNTSPYTTTTGEDGNTLPLNWAKVPLIPLKYNECEIPLYGAVKVRYDGETKGGVETLEIKVNAENYKAIIEIFKKAIIENGMGYDAKDDRLSGNPNQMNIQSMYSDIDLDANDMETELQAAFEEILWFVNAHLANTGQGNFDGEEVNIIFNRDILINESEAIDNCQKSVGILSDETIVGMHPWVDDPQLELDRLKKQKEEQQAEFEAQQFNPFAPQQQKGNAPPDDEGGTVNE